MHLSLCLVTACLGVCAIFTLSCCFDQNYGPPPPLQIQFSNHEKCHKHAQRHVTPALHVRHSWANYHCLVNILWLIGVHHWFWQEAQAVPPLSRNHWKELWVSEWRRLLFDFVSSLSLPSLLAVRFFESSTLFSWLLSRKWLLQLTGLWVVNLNLFIASDILNLFPSPYASQWSTGSCIECLVWHTASAYWIN